MSGVLGSLFRSNNKTPQRAAGVNLNTSVYGKPISIIYGTTRVASNLLLYGNFVAQAQYSNSNAGGKGGGGSGSGQVSGYNYSATLAFALCEGPIVGIGTVYVNKNLKTLASFTDTLFTGTFPQTPWAEAIKWSYDDQQGNLISGTVKTQLGYNGIAYIAFPDKQLGSSPDLPNFQYEVLGFFSSTSAPDADPSLVLTDLLTSSHHGLGFPSAKLGSLSVFQNYTNAAGLLVSPAYDTQRTCADIVDELALATNSAPIWTSGKFTLVPYGDTALTAPGWSYTPSTAVYFLTDADFIKSPQGGGQLSGGAVAPVVLERKRASDKTNSIQIEFLDRSNNYAPSIAYANDQGLIDNFGLRSNGSRQMHLFCLASAANLSAHLQLRRLARISNYYYFDLDQRYILLDPMDIIAISDSNLGLVNQLVRILEIDENDDGTLSFTCEEYLGTQGQPSFNFGTGAGSNQNPDSAALAVNAPVIFEPPSALLDGQGTRPEVWIAACGGSTTATDLNWGGANVWLATPPSSAATYRRIGQITNPARMGYVTAALAAHNGSNPDSTGVLTVDLTESGGVLNSGSTADAAVANTLCLVNGELISYTNASLVSGNVYNLTGLYRGLYGTGNVSHIAGEQFARLDDAIFKYTLNATYVNQPLLIKLQSLNVYGQGVQQLASVTAYEYVPAGSALLHPLGQTLNIASVDSGVLTSANAAVFEDYGYIASQVPGGTIYHMPIGTDLGALGGAFSVQLPQGAVYAMFSGTSGVLTRSGTLSGSPTRATSTTTGRTTFATWFNRQTFADTQNQILIGQGGYQSTAPGPLPTGIPNPGNIFIGFSTADVLTVWGILNNFDLGSSISTTFTIASTVSITSSGWHQLTVSIFASTSTAGQIIVYLDNSSVAGLTISSAMETPGVSAGVIVQRQLGQSTVSTFNVPGKIFGVAEPVGFNNFAGFLAETYFIDGQTLTSTSFTASSVGPPLSFTNFVGLSDAYLNYANPNGVGLDVSGKNNAFFASTVVTSTMVTLNYPTN